MAMRRAPPLVFPSPKQHTATVIFAHGLGDSGHGWASAVENWRRRQRLDEVKFILPNAPSIPITVNGGYRMPGWFDIKELADEMDPFRRPEDEAGVKVSIEYFHSLIQAEIDAGIPSDRIVLGGFSQGGAMSIISGLTAPVKLGGIIGMSSWLLLNRKFRQLLPKPELNQDTPLLMCHGDEDPVVKTVLGKLSYQMLNTLGYKVTWKEYPGMGHSACLEELDDVEEFLRERLPPKGDSANDKKDDGKSEL
ncbi:Acyl-protein thioesterase 1 [Pleurostoma richardsiae]|uniref:Acyl-protein thioesterase 1 n=1 Tax=Pleurostoma richardsiae TaxID=41990 RepID=A0AA38VP44_9PEZI|nr:Acyl-protein thioesterase 1 [Pleurostoma richardsiae]